jgi:AcrR family transcriptional regulator
VTKPNFLTPQQRRLRNREEMIATIVQAARDIMREEGVAALNLNEIARRLGMKPPSLYEYFPNKMALYDHLFRIGVHLFGERLAESTDNEQLPIWEQVERVFTVYLQTAIDNPELFKLVYERHVPGFVPSDTSMAESIAVLEDANQHLRRILKSEEIQVELPLEQMRDILIALIHGISALHLANSPDEPIGKGRFGVLIPPMIEILKKAWGKQS